MTIAMYIFGALTIVAALGVVFSGKPLNSALSLVATLFLVACHFAMLGADFVAALQVLVYAGAIMVLVVFVIMLLGLDEKNTETDGAVPRYLAAAIGGVFAGLMVFVFSRDVVFPLGIAQTTAEFGSASVSGEPKEVGLALITEYLFPFQMAGLLLLAAVIGAVLLAYEKRRPLLEGRGLSAVRQKYNG